MITQCYNLYVHPDRNDPNTRDSMMVQIFLWDALESEKFTTEVSEEYRIFHGLVFPSEFLDVLNDKYDEYKISSIGNRIKFLYKVFPTHADALFDLFEEGYVSIGMRYSKYTAEEFSFYLRKILNQQISGNRVLRPKRRLINKKNLGLISQIIKDEFLDTREPLS